MYVTNVNVASVNGRLSCCAWLHFWMKMTVNWSKNCVILLSNRNAFYFRLKVGLPIIKQHVDMCFKRLL